MYLREERRVCRMNEVFEILPCHSSEDKISLNSWLYFIVKMVTNCFSNPQKLSQKVTFETSLEQGCQAFLFLVMHLNLIVAPTTLHLFFRLFISVTSILYMFLR